jgi:hypothetical protein
MEGCKESADYCAFVSSLMDFRGPVDLQLGPDVGVHGGKQLHYDLCIPVIMFRCKKLDDL